MEIGAKEARGKFSLLLKTVEKGEEVIILRRGKQIARLVPSNNSKRTLPALKEFRASIRIKGGPLSVDVARSREEERY
jgi:prevent-host-death family protein